MIVSFSTHKPLIGWHAHGFAWPWFDRHMATQGRGHATRRALLVAVALCAVASTPPARATEPEKRFTAEETAFFEKEVLPLLKTNCLKCHGEGKIRGGLRLTS